MTRSRSNPKDSSELCEAFKDAATGISQRPNVLFITLGNKRVKGKKTKQQALIVYVSKKTDVRRSEAIPKRRTIQRSDGRARSLPTDVVPLLGSPRLLGVQAGDIILSGDAQSWGTSCLTFSKNGRSYVSTNAHVLANLATHTVPTANPAIQEPSTHQIYSTGPIVYVSPFPLGQPTAEDFAVVWTESLATDDLAILNLPESISRFGRFSDNPTANYWYATNGAFIQCAHPEQHINPPAAMTVGTTTINYYNFWVLTVLQGTPEHGHSGSIVCRGSGQDIEACGILFGGGGPNYAFVFELEPIYNKAYATLP